MRFFIFSIATLIFLFTFSIAKAVNPTFNLIAKNFTMTDSIGTGGISYDAMTFDLVIEHTNLANSGPFEYALGQYYFNLSSIIGVTADYNYYVVPGSTQFTNPTAVPRNPTYVSPDATSPLGASFRLGSNTVLGAGNGPIVAVSPGTRICTMRFKKKVGSFPMPFMSNLNMTWRTALPNPFTKVFAYIGTTSTDNTAYGTYSVDNSVISYLDMPQLLNPVNNSVGNPVTNNFIWKKMTSVYKYRLQIATDSVMNNVFADSSVFGDTSLVLGGFNYAVKYYWKVTAYDIFNNNRTSATWNFTVLEIPSLKLKLTAVLEGMYYPLFNIVSRRDTFTVELRETVSPYNLVDSKKGVLDSLNFTSLVQFPYAPQGTYYIVFKHINSIVTWSKSGGETFNYTDTVNCNFSTAASQAFGSNLKLKGSKYCIISGDVDRDGYIDASDASPIDNDSYISRTGRFLPTDLNGDNFVDADDMTIQDNNRNRSVIQP